MLETEGAWGSGAEGTRTASETDGSDAKSLEAQSSLLAGSDTQEIQAVVCKQCKVGNAIDQLAYVSLAHLDCATTPNPQIVDPGFSL